MLLKAWAKGAPTVGPVPAQIILVSDPEELKPHRVLGFRSTPFFLA